MLRAVMAVAEAKPRREGTVSLTLEQHMEDARDATGERREEEDALCT